MDHQILRFSALYHNNREAVARALTSMWCGEVNNESQRAYVKQIKEHGLVYLYLIIKKIML